MMMGFYTTKRIKLTQCKKETNIFSDKILLIYFYYFSYWYFFG